MAEEKELKDTIAPETIVFNESVPVDDADMPQAETKVYTSYVKVTPVFMMLFHKCVDTLPYNTYLRNENGKQIRLIDFVRFIEHNNQKCTVDDMNEVISYIRNLDFLHARPLMEVLEKDQSKLMTVFEE